MLSRRHLRVKLLQSLYAFFHSESNDLEKGEKDLFNSIDQVYDLYVSFFDLFIEIKDYEFRILEERKQKKLPTEADLKPNLKFVENAIFSGIENSESFKEAKKSRKITWADHDDVVRKILMKIKSSEAYQTYMENPSRDLEEDKKLVITIFKEFIADNELLRDHFEEENIYWYDDVFFVCSAIVKTIKAVGAKNDSFELFPLFKDEEDDRLFLTTIYRHTIMDDDQLGELIKEKTKNWEMDRIASMDMLLMKMGITELKRVESVPVKVTLNEFIELAKMYSTPKSKVFINGILDKVLIDLKRNGQIKKSGRGLME